MVINVILLQLIKSYRDRHFIIDEPIIDEPIIEEEEIIPDNFDNDFLSELNNSNFQKELEEEENKEANLKQQKELLKEQERQRK